MVLIHHRLHRFSQINIYTFDYKQNTSVKICVICGEIIQCGKGVSNQPRRAFHVRELHNYANYR